MRSLSFRVVIFLIVTLMPASLRAQRLPDDLQRLNRVDVKADFERIREYNENVSLANERYGRAAGLRRKMWTMRLLSFAGAAVAYQFYSTSKDATGKDGAHYQDMALGTGVASGLLFLLSASPSGKADMADGEAEAASEHARNMIRAWSTQTVDRVRFIEIR